MKKLSLRTRLVLAFSGFSVLLALFYWFVMWGILLLTEDEIFNRQLSIELNRQLAYFEEHQRYDHLPNDMILTYESDLKDYPLHRKIKESDEVLFELEGLDTHIARGTEPHTGNEFFIIYDVSKQEIDDFAKTLFIWIGLVSFLIVSGFGIVIGSFMGIRTSHPIIRLDQRIQGLKQSQDFGETDSFGDDEIGRLANSFSEAYERSQGFLAREKRFTREVSHELRTPSAVIQGALEILEIQPGNEKALGRIRRASKEMQQLIDTFLLLGREENLSLSDETLDIEAIVHHLLEEYQESTDVSLSYQLVSNPELKVLPPVFAVLLGNLLSNAIRHTHQGQITVLIKHNSLTIEDTGEGFSTEILQKLGEPYLSGSRGSGLGLSIVKRICQQFDWQLEIDSSPGKGSCVKVIFIDTER